MFFVACQIFQVKFFFVKGMLSFSNVSTQSVQRRTLSKVFHTKFLLIVFVEKNLYEKHRAD